MSAVGPVARRTSGVGARAHGEGGRALARKLANEFVGTFFLIFTFAAASAKTGAGPLAPLAVGGVLMVMVFAGAHVSGAHYNPAVSLAVTFRGKMDRREMFAYVLAQLLAAVCAGLIARALSGAPAPFAPAVIWKALLVEFLFTFALAYVVLNVATSATTKGNSFYGLAIGFTVVVGGLAVGGISGGAFNPAVALGACVIGMEHWSHIWIYVLADLLGASAAAAAFLCLDGGHDEILGSTPEPAAQGVSEPTAG
jgi:aquaporin Z